MTIIGLLFFPRKQKSFLIGFLSHGRDKVGNFADRYDDLVEYDDLTV